MKQFKKRTLALVLASVVTVVGAFGAENYKNSLMALNFSTTRSGGVNVTLQTKEKLTNSISPIRKSASTYVIMLPETNSEVPSGTALGESIESLDIQTMPYTKESNGYTKITITTKSSAPLYVNTLVYVPPGSMPDMITTTQTSTASDNDNNSSSRSRRSRNNSSSNTIRSQSGVDQITPVDINESLKQFQSQSQTTSKKKKAPTKEMTTLNDLQEADKPSSHQELLYIILGVAFVIVTSFFLMLKAKDKLVEITGEQANYDVSDEPKPGDKKKKDKEKAKTGSKSKLNTTIKNIDKKYSRPVTMPTSQSAEENSSQINDEEEVQEVAQNIVDLDELLNEQSKQASTPSDTTEGSKFEEPRNNALEDFLSTYNFDEEDEDGQEEQAEEEQGIDEELYDKCINDENLEFSKDDVDRIETLIDSEISDDTKRHASEFLESSEKNRKPSALELLEKFVTTYITQQNLTFTKEDVEALYKLISVELDEDFITDLRTNPSRMQEMQDEIARQKSKPHKTSELLTLNVKDMLPDLSEALKKQGGRRIESEVKPQVVYASEGYEVSTLKLNMDLPDLSKELNNEDAYKVRPSDDIQYVDTSYEVQKMSIGNELPDLEDMLKHPEKYETPKEKEVEVDEEALLKNISNVTFKPFDDGTRDFEILNDFGPAPTVSDMQEEFNQFGDNFEIISDEDDVQVEIKETDQNDFETLYDGKYVDLDKEHDAGAAQDGNSAASQEASKPQNSSSAAAQAAQTIRADGENTKPMRNETEIPDITDLEPVSSESNELLPSVNNAEIDLEPVKNSDNSLKEYSKPEDLEEVTEADKLLSKIKRLEQDRRAKIVAKQEAQAEMKGIKSGKITPRVPTPEFCILEGERFNIVNASYFTDRMGCYLAKNSKGYCIIGFAGDSVFKIKYYEKLDTEKLQSRVSEKLEDGTVRYIVRIGIHKFILNVKENDMEFVMDLC